MRIAVVTPTKDRPEAVDLCRRWFREQTRPPANHIIASGGGVYGNLLAGIEHARQYDVIVFADDDDHYAPSWLAWIEEQFADAAVMAAGQIVTRMHHIRASAFRDCRAGPLPGTMAFRSTVAYDVASYMRAGVSPKQVFADFEVRRTDVQHVTHIKGLYPGAGVSKKHSADRFPHDDPNHAELRSAIGDDATHAFLAAAATIDTRTQQV